MFYFRPAFCLYFISICYYSESFTVRIKPGQVRGSFLKTRDCQNIYSFRAIPYAEPPVGSLRFKPAIPKKTWKGVLDATKDGPICPQNAYRQFNMSEDCLFVNVYSRDLCALKPVMVFLHSGAFKQSTGRSDLYGPEYLLERDIVLVTLNYRLGILGFIATDTAEAPGNLGFKDQVLALKWVQENIRSFGGDPNLVTLFGQSAGSLSCGAQLISPMSKGLFHRTIMMSGSPTELIPPLNYRGTRVIADYVGCPLNNSLVECLRGKSVNELLEASTHLNEFGTDPLRKWNVVVEKDFGQERFMIEDPNESMIKGNFHRIPVMGGMVAGEFVRFAYKILVTPNLLEATNDDRYNTNPISLLYTRVGNRSRLITDRLREHYVSGANFSTANFREMIILWGDAIVRFRLGKYLERAMKYENVYIYSNSYIGRYSQLYYPANEPYTVAHGDDLQYIFFMKHGFAPLFSKRDKENFMVERMTNIWTTFAREGTPYANSSNMWLPSTNTFEQTYDLSGDQNVKKFESFIGVWYELYPDP